MLALKQQNLQREICHTIMNPKELTDVALEHGGYETPELNETLYLHYKGYRRIENLEPYINLKALWLDSNGFDTIENLDRLQYLRCLYLQRNLLTKIENLESLQNLVHLDLSENRIKILNGLSSLPILSTLNLAKNCLCDSHSISHLQECPSISSIDFSNNDLNGDDLIPIFSKLHKLTSMNMNGNPALSDVKDFRKRVISIVKGLLYLDRPVFEIERAGVEAWALGGRKAELKVKQEWHEMKKKQEKQSLQDFREWQAVVRAKKLQQIQEIKKYGPSIEDIENSKILESKKTKRMQAAAREAEKERSLYEIKSENSFNYAEKNEIIQNDHDKSVHYDQKNLCNDKTENTLIGLSNEEEINTYNPTLTEESPNIFKLDVKNEINSIDTSGNPSLIQFEDAKETISAQQSKENEEIVTIPTKSSILTIQNQENNIPCERDSETEMKKLVTESLSIYRKEKGNASIDSAKELFNKTIPITESREEKISHSKTQKILSWNSDMDASLSELVKEYLFDFKIVSVAMQQQFPSLDVLFTPNVCRLRWSTIESNFDNDYANCLSSQRAQIFFSGGDQVSYEELLKRSLSEQSKFLTLPEDFPNSTDYIGETDDDSNRIFNSELERKTVIASLLKNVDDEFKV